MQEKRKNGFTLVELLVVIAIIALLMAILMPSLQHARQQGAAIYCCSNQKQLAIAWIIYAQDNDNRLVSALPSDDPRIYGWVGVPAGSSLEEKIEAVKRGLLFPYVRNEKAYHCPSDRRKLDWNQNAYCSYSIPTGLDGAGVEYSKIVPIRNIIQIKLPSSKCAFVEDFDPRGSNLGSWAIHEPWDLDKWDWEDALALWHNKRTTLCFADGHAETHTWQDQRTVRYFEWVRDTKPGWLSSTVSPYPNQVDNPDIIFMKRAFAFKAWAK
jgi:prepilin-type N-terminal cleavage/methylation domain-containing protein/prepilin-type processing-associated H-X9-DG protein